MKYLFLFSALCVSGLASAAPKYTMDTSSLSPASPVLRLNLDSDMLITYAEIIVTFSNLPDGIKHTMSSVPRSSSNYRCTNRTLNSAPNELTVRAAGAISQSVGLSVPTEGVCKIEFDFTDVSTVSGNISVTKVKEKYENVLYAPVYTSDTKLPEFISYQSVGGVSPIRVVFKDSFEM